MKKKYMLVLLSFLLVGCQGYTTHIEDINGDDTRIQKQYKEMSKLLKILGIRQ
jgi:hypothetical protein